MFSPGVVAGSLAASVQAAVGNVAAGSMFAVAQSLAVLGVSTSTSVLAGTVAGSGVLIANTETNDKL